MRNFEVYPDRSRRRMKASTGQVVASSGESSL